MEIKIKKQKFYPTMRARKNIFNTTSVTIESIHRGASAFNFWLFEKVD